MLRWQVISLSIYLTTLSSVTTHSVVNPNTHPPNVVVPIGHPVTFPLTYSPCNWDRNVNKDLVPIYRPSENISVTSSNYSLNQTVLGQCDLTIRNVTFFDAGLYQYGNGDAYGLDVFVIDKKPVCFVEPDGTEAFVNGSVTLGCSLSFSNKDKKLAPVLRWLLTLTEHDKSLRSGKETTVLGADHDTITSLVIVPSGTPINEVVCFAQLGGIPASSSDDKVAQNRISFDSHCQIGHIEVLAKNIRILNDMNMKIGDTIVCTADGYPEVKYYWTKDGVPICEGPDVVLDSAGLHAYRCFAYNAIQGRNHTSFVETLILVQEGKEIKNITGLVLSILALLGVVGIIIVLLVLWLKYRHHNIYPIEHAHPNQYRDETGSPKLLSRTHKNPRPQPAVMPHTRKNPRPPSAVMPHTRMNPRPHSENDDKDGIYEASASSSELPEESSSLIKENPLPTNESDESTKARE